MLRRLYLLGLLLLPMSTAAQNIDTSQIYKRCAPAVVLLLTEKGGTALRQGSGVIMSSDGTIVSALHVVEGADRVIVKLKNGDIYEHVKVLALDPRRDLVILKVPGFDLPTVAFGNSNQLTEGEPTIIISNPKGLEQTIAQGVISALRTPEGLGFQVIQTSIPASPGSSGGALLNSKGELVGIVSFKLVGGENLNFGIPANYVRGMLDYKEAFPLSEIQTRVAAIGTVKSLDAIGKTGVSRHLRRMAKRQEWQSLQDTFGRRTCLPRARWPDRPTTLHVLLHV